MPATNTNLHSTNNPNSILQHGTNNTQPYITIHNAHASCTIYLQGAHITSFKPHNQDELLWLSKTALFENGKAVRGGIPICWPWFGADTSGKGLAQHGFARNMSWHLAQCSNNEKDETVVILELNSNKHTKELWNYDFTLSYKIIVGKTLTLKLTTRNTDTKPFELTQALHSYFNVHDIALVSLDGLENLTYIDQLQSNQHFTQTTPLTIDQEIDRIYHDSNTHITLKEKQREITIHKSASKSTVVWNPWKTKAKQMQDFDNEGYKKMLCVETANTNTFDPIVLEPNKSYTLTQKISVL